jgi:hypothetical protein
MNMANNKNRHRKMPVLTTYTSMNVDFEGLVHCPDDTTVPCHCPAQDELTPFVMISCHGDAPFGKKGVTITC